MDGTEWERIRSDTFSGVPDADGIDGEQYIADVISGPWGLLAVGADEFQEQRDMNAAVWISGDGRDWSRIEDESLGGDVLGSL